MMVKLLASCIALVVAAAAAAEWRPADNPLMTRWAKDVSPENARPEYPRPQMVRQEWQNLNGLWDYALAPKDAPRPDAFDGKILVPFPLESALSGVRKRLGADQRLWYRRTFAVPKSWRSRRVLLHFGAVDWEATVWVNSTELGTHRGGYDAFSFDITPALRPGEEQEIVLAVFDPTSSGDQPRGKQVNNPRGIWYTPTSGIWQTVWLEPVPESHITSLHITPDVDNRRVIVDVAASKAGERTHAEAQVPGGKPVPSSNPHRAIVQIPEPKLWSPDSPHLYDLTVTWHVGGKVVDTVRSYFGMRKVEVRKDADGVPRIFLNGEFVFQIGFLDQGFWPDGLYTAATDAALRYDIEVTRQLGMNLARKHVKIEPDRWYYWADKLGLLVWQDMPNGNNKTPESRKQFEAELRALVQGRWNHPSIIMWVPFNEGWGQHDTERYVQVIKGLDPTRLVNNASGWKDRKAGDVHDIHSYPGPAAPPVEEKRAIVLGEFGGLGLGVPGHTWAEKHWGYRGMASREELTDRYVKLLRKLWQLVRDKGLSAAVYTQTSDVETECNGLMTYDRALTKPDVATVAKANRGDFPPPPKVVPLVPTAEQEAQTWRTTTEKPPVGWEKPDFDDSAWKEAPAGFGEPSTPGSKVRTRWKSADIWARRTFRLDRTDFTRLAFRMHHDEDAEVYLNGVLAAKVRGYTVDYEEFPVAPKAQAALKKGENVLAVHCHQTRGGQYIDVGLVDLIPVAPKGK